DYLVEPSYPVLFDTLIFRNQRAAPADSLLGITRDDLLRSLVKYHKDDTVRISDNDRLIEKLQYTGDYNFVRLKDSLLPDHGSALILQMEERIPGNMRTSTFYETYSGFGVSADLRHNNFAGDMDEVRAGLSLATLRQTLYAGFGSPLILGYLIRFDNDFSVNFYQTQDILNPQAKPGQGMFGGDFLAVNSTRLTWPWSYWLRLVSDAELEATSRVITLDSLERDLSLNFIQTAFLTFVNQPMDPTRGVRFAFTWGNGGPLQRRDVWRFAEFRHNWFEAQTAQYFYLPALSMIKLATRLDGGRFFGEGGANSQRFFLGGSRSVRSYLFQTLCPEQSSGDVCTGQDETLAYFLTSAELRLEPFWFIRQQSKLKHFIPLQVVPFTDFGKVWDVPRGFFLHEPDGSLPPGQGYAAGLGLRYPLLGIFNLRLDWALWRSGPKMFWLDLAQAF
ncbi:MAG: surface antigen, partial [Fibrobacteres bacterium]|nr:surface antigen [Fibrobacterota bacterium]